MNQAKQFRDLHYSERPLLIANAWDVSSAKYFSESGFKAVATSSSALADTQGYLDGENSPFKLLLEIAGRMKSQVTVPLSVDMEKGFGRTVDGVLANIEELCKIGVSGINIEDSGITGPDPLKPVEIITNLISAIRDFLYRKKLDIFINARTDAFARKLPNALEETIKRVKAYEAAGADGVFPITIHKESDIRAVAAACSIPVNVVSMKELPDLATLAQWGVRRVSMGSTMYRSVQADFKRKVQMVKAEGSFRNIF
jgi:2-methylisocitrate lyase-like PEP mutase family enzyme